MGTTQAVGRTLPKNAKIVEQTDEYADTPYFRAGLPADAKMDEETNVLPWLEGEEHSLSGIYRGIRTAKKPNKAGNLNVYALFEDFGGAKFRVWCFKYLEVALRGQAVGASLNIVNLGMKPFTNAAGITNDTYSAKINLVTIPQ